MGSKQSVISIFFNCLGSLLILAFFTSPIWLNIYAVYWNYEQGKKEDALLSKINNQNTFNATTACIAKGFNYSEWEFSVATKKSSCERIGAKLFDKNGNMIEYAEFQINGLLTTSTNIETGQWKEAKQILSAYLYAEKNGLEISRSGDRCFVAIEDSSYILR